MCAAAAPAANYIVSLGDKICGAPEVEVWERFAEIGHECLNVLAATPRFVQRVLKKHVGRSKFIDDVEIVCLAPEIGEPTPHDGFVVIFLGHGEFLID